MAQSPSNHAKFRRIFDTHVPIVHLYCLRRLRVADANDAVSEVFLVTWRRIEHVPGGEETLPWLLAFEYPPEFGIGPFDDWVARNQSEDAGVDFGDWASVADAERGGILRAQYVEEWLAELEASNCSYEISRDFVRCQP